MNEFINVCESFEQFKYTVLLIRLMAVFWEKFVRVWTNFESFIENFETFKKFWVFKKF